MDEHDLATEMSNFTYTDHAMRMSEQEEGGLEKGARKVDFNAGLHEI